MCKLRGERYFHRMDMHKILARVDARIADLGTKPATVSRQATGSPDTIRNWRRRVDRGEAEVGASMTTLRSMADVLKVPLNWLLGEGPDSLDEYQGENGDRATLLRIFDRLDPADRAKALKIVSTLAEKEGE